MRRRSGNNPTLDPESSSSSLHPDAKEVILTLYLSLIHHGSHSLSYFVMQILSNPPAFPTFGDGTTCAPLTLAHGLQLGILKEPTG